MPTIRQIERIFENLLWGSRLVMLGAVIASMVMALCMFILSTVQFFYLVGQTRHYTMLALNGTLDSDARTEIVTSIIKTVDNYLIVAILLLVAWGLYDLFIGKINSAETSEVTPRLFSIRGLDDLKDRIVKLLILVLAIEFFQYAVQLRYDEPLDLFYLAAGILLIGGAFYLTSKHQGS